MGEKTPEMASDAADEGGPICLENLLDDIEGRLESVMDGICAIMDELRALRAIGTESKAAWKRERPPNWQWGPPQPEDGRAPE